PPENGIGQYFLQYSDHFAGEVVSFLLKNSLSYITGIMARESTIRHVNPHIIPLGKGIMWSGENGQRKAVLAGGTPRPAGFLDSFAARVMPGCLGRLGPGAAAV